jgi:hypothetical protein
MSDSSGVNEDNVPLMKAMSLEIERLEAELRSATRKAEGCMRQARVYKQVAEALTEERDALKAAAAEAAAKRAANLQEYEANRPKREAQMQQWQQERQQVLDTLKQERDTLKQERDTLEQERDTLKQEAAVHKQEAEVLTWQLARAKETRSESLLAEEFEKKECTVCLERPAHVAVVPCGHRCFCTDAECSARVSALRTCPLCRMPIAGTLRIF